MEMLRYNPKWKSKTDDEISVDELVFKIIIPKFLAQTYYHKMPIILKT